MIAQANLCQKNLVISDPDGLHLRPAALLVKIANCFSSDITVRIGDFSANAKSIMSVIGLDARHRAEVTVETSGGDAQQAMQEISRLFERNFENVHDEGQGAGTPREDKNSNDRPAV